MTYNCHRCGYPYFHCVLTKAHDKIICTCGRCHSNTEVELMPKLPGDRSPQSRQL